MPTVGVGKRGRVGCFLLIIVLIAPEDILESTDDVRRPPFTAAVVRGPNLGGSRNHCNNDDTGLEPTNTVIQELGSEGRVPQILEEAVD